MKSTSLTSTAISATLHCLTGCAIGEITGMVLGEIFGLSSLVTIALSVSLAFLFGYLLSALPLVQSGLSLGTALRLVLAADTVSILTMEIVDNAVMYIVPGAMGAGLVNPIFWVSMAGALFVAFWAAYPINRLMIARGKGHAVIHSSREHAHHAGHASAHTMDNRPLLYAITAFLAGGLLVSVAAVSFDRAEYEQLGTGETMQHQR